MIAALITFLGIVVIIASGCGSAESMIAVMFILLIWYSRRVCIDESKAYINFVEYWAHPERRNKCEEAVKRETEREKLARWREEDRRRKSDGVVRVSGVATAGEVEQAGGTMIVCRVCGGLMREENRIRYGSGAVYATCKCEKCGRDTPVKVA